VYRIESSIQIGKKLGMQLLDDHLWELFDNDLIELDEMVDKSRNPSEVMEKAEKKAGAPLKMKKKVDDEYGQVLKTG